jgi:hypothetical protein
LSCCSLVVSVGLFLHESVAALEPSLKVGFVVSTYLKCEVIRFCYFGRSRNATAAAAGARAGATKSVVNGEYDHFAIFEQFNSY